MAPDWAVERYRAWKYRGQAFIPTYWLALRKVEAAVARRGCCLLLHQTSTAVDSDAASRFSCDIYVVAKASKQDLSARPAS